MKLPSTGYTAREKCCFRMDDPNITMEEYIRLEEEKAQKYGKVFNWELLSMVRSDETSLSGYVEEEQNFLYFNDLFPFNIIYPDDLKSDKDNDDNEIDMIQSSRDMAPLLPHDQRHLWLHYQVVGYTEEIVYDFEQRLETIFRRQVNRVHILDFEGLTPDMRHNLVERLKMVYTGDDGDEVFVSHAWRRLFGIRAPLVQEFILEFFSTCRIVLGLHTAKEMAEDKNITQSQSP
ncbi:hypothetical protein Tco_0907255 [Tanacetum coccineum]|uniref:Uncharacterized protein n=1 Tax=Tanacetum coccineum TaxID=301880 RepID=A0ABQ5CJQ6_9ASTR